MSKMTHIGMEVGMAYNRGLKREIKLRETEKYYISEYGTKYRKNDGYINRKGFVAFKLDISSIKTLYKNIKQKEINLWKQIKNIW